MIGSSYIGGCWRESGRTSSTSNPSDLSETVGQYAVADASDARDALAAARDALPGWKRFNMQMRSDLLRKVGDALYARSSEIGELLAREEGKVLRDGVAEAVRAAQVFHFYAGEVVRNPGQWYNSMRDGHNIVVTSEPVGVVAAITPWNFPIAIPAWKVAAALAYGNTVVLKPSDMAPGCVVMLAQLFAEAGLPAGVFNLVLGPGRELGTILVQGADAVTFTGGTATGRNVLRAAAEAMTKTQLELGGKNPFIVIDDADLDVAVEAAAQGSFGQTGQRCTGSERIIVTRGIHDAFVDRLLDRVAKFKVGHALAPDTDLGPVANQPQFDQNLGFVARARAEGAEVAFGGGPVEAETRGLFFAPTVLLKADNGMASSREESFGPIASVIMVEDLDEAIAVANDSEYALSSGIATTSLKSAEYFRRESKAGLVMVNTPTAGLEYHVPFGGRPPSGCGGREAGTAAAEFFTESKTAYINHGVI